MSGDFITYEYKAKTVKADKQARTADIYECFGWELTGSAVSAAGKVVLSFKRDRKIRHRQELIKLERQAEETECAIDKFTAGRTRFANIFAGIFGIIAVLVLGGGMSMTMLKSGASFFAGGIVLGVAGLILCVANYFIYKKIVDVKTGKLAPVIDDCQEKLYYILEKAEGLLSAELI